MERRVFVKGAFLLAGVVFVLVWFGLAIVFIGPANIADVMPMLWKMRHPALDSETLGIVLKGSVWTLEMAVFGTIGGLLLALPLALVATAMGRAGRILMWPFAYGLQVIPALILVVFTTVIFGLGLEAGIAALAVSGGGSFAWFLIRDLGGGTGRASSIETSSQAKGVIDNFRVAGPLIVRAMTEQWQANIRNAVIIGVVGGGGIGWLWMQWIRLLEYHKVGTVILAMIVLIALADGLAALTRWLAAAKARRFQ